MVKTSYKRSHKKKKMSSKFSTKYTNDKHIQDYMKQIRESSSSELKDLLQYHKPKLSITEKFMRRLHKYNTN